MTVPTLEWLFAIRLVLGAALLVFVGAAALLADRLAPARRARQVPPELATRARERLAPVVVRH